MASINLAGVKSNCRPVFRRIHTKKPLYIICFVFILILIVRILISYNDIKLVVNYTKSEPYGIYLENKIDAARMFKNMMIQFPVPERFKSLVYGRHWVDEGLPLIKNIGALAGDEVCITDQDIKINGQRMGKVFIKDSKGLPLPKLRGCFTIKPGYFFPFSDYIDKSFDGRYMGQLPLSIITSELKPLWTI